MPVTVSGDVEFLVTRNQAGWLVALINNRGVSTEITKVAGADRQENPPCRIDPLKEAVVQVWPRVAVTAGRELVAGDAVRTDTDGGKVRRCVQSDLPPDFPIWHVLS